MNPLTSTSRRNLSRAILLVGLLQMMASTGLAQYVVTTYAGDGVEGFAGDGGPATSSRLEWPAGVAVDTAGNLFIADSFNSRIRKVNPDGRIETVAGNGVSGSGGDNGPATSASLSYPLGVAVDSVGNLFIADACNHRIRKVAPNGVITTFAALNGLCDYYEGPYRATMAVDAADNLFVADTLYHRILKISPGGVITTVAGSGRPGFDGDSGLATSARLSYPSGVAIDGAGNLFIADTSNSRIRKVTPDAIITTFAGSEEFGFSGDGGPAASARLSAPNGVAVDNAGNVYISDAGNNRIRKVAPDGIITTVAGNGNYGFGGDGGIATAATFHAISGIAVDSAGTLFISDSSNHRIRKLTPVAAPTLSAISQDVGAPGMSFTIDLNGTNLFAPLTVVGNAGIQVSNVQVLSLTRATATMTIAPNAVLGPHDLAVTTLIGTSNATTFRVVAPFPDLSVTSTQSGPFLVGFNGTNTIIVKNNGALDTSGEIRLTDTLPAGLTYVSGTGSGWACSASGPNVTCANPGPLVAGASTSVALTVAVAAEATAGVAHQVAVDVAGDRVLSNNSLDSPVVAVAFAPRFRFIATGTPSFPAPGSQARVEMTLPAALPYDVTGTLTLSFAPDAVNPADDPAIQFATGGRQVSFVFPANTLNARFSGSTPASFVSFQAGTVAGTLTFEATSQTSVVSASTATFTVPRQAPVIRNVQVNNTANGTEVSITVLSAVREITQLSLGFETQPEVRVSCGSAAGCTASGSRVTFDVKAIFDGWYTGDRTSGGLSKLRFPFSIRGSVEGRVNVTLRNSLGGLGVATFQIPSSR